MLSIFRYTKMDTQTEKSAITSPLDVSRSLTKESSEDPLIPQEKAKVSKEDANADVAMNEEASSKNVSNIKEGSTTSVTKGEISNIPNTTGYSTSDVVMTETTSPSLSNKKNHSCCF